MGRIVDSVRQVTDIMGQIAAASVEQSASIEQVNHAIAHMDDMTQRNAALVGQAAGSAESMRVQAAALAQVVAAFKSARAPHRPASDRGAMFITGDAT